MMPNRRAKYPSHQTQAYSIPTPRHIGVITLLSSSSCRALSLRLVTILERYLPVVRSPPTHYPPPQPHISLQIWVSPSLVCSRAFSAKRRCVSESARSTLDEQNMPGRLHRRIIHTRAKTQVSSWSDSMPPVKPRSCTSSSWEKSSPPSLPSVRGDRGVSSAGQSTRLTGIRFQRRNGRIQEHFVYSVGCRRTGQDPTFVEALCVVERLIGRMGPDGRLPKHPGYHLRRRLKRPRANHRGS